MASNNHPVYQLLYKRHKIKRWGLLFENLEVKIN